MSYTGTTEHWKSMRQSQVLFFQVAATGQEQLTIECMEHKMFRIEHNVETGEVKEILLSAAEIKEIEKEAQIIAAKIATENAAATAKATERAALLAKLGITAGEAALLLS
jgi:phage-related tail protein